jgi:DNA polymerase-1
MIYGGTEWGFFLDIDMPKFTIKKWRSIIKKFFKKYSTLKNWQDKNITLMFRTGQMKIFTGRKFVFHKIREDKYGDKTYSENHAKNYPVQGLAGGDILPLACVILRRGLLKYGFKSQLILTVHDSIVLDVVAEEAERLLKLCYSVVNHLQEYIKGVYGYDWRTKIEGECEIGKNYGDLYYVAPNTSLKEMRSIMSE